MLLLAPRLAPALFSALIGCNVLLQPMVAPPAFAAEPPAAAVAALKAGFAAIEADDLAVADAKLGDALAGFRAARAPPTELAALHKARGDVREARGDLRGALADFAADAELLASLGAGGADAAADDDDYDEAEAPRALASLARVELALGRFADAERHYSGLLADDDALPPIERDSPFPLASRATARARLAQWRGARDDARAAATRFAETGDAIRALLSRADAALFATGVAADAAPAVAAAAAPDAAPAAAAAAAAPDARAAKTAEEEMRLVFASRGAPASNNPDDVPLLQELARKDAELHLALAALLYAEDPARLARGGEGEGVTPKGDATARTARAEWVTGCVRLRAYVDDGQKRAVADDAADLKRRGAADRAAPTALPVGPELRGLFAAGSGLDPQSPYVTQRGQESFYWYKIAGRPVRRDAGAPLAQVGAGAGGKRLSCRAFADEDWVDAERPDWPAPLRAALSRYAAARDPDDDRV